VQTPVALAKALIVRERLTPQQIRSVQVTVSDATYTNPGFRNVAPFAEPIEGSWLSRVSSPRATAADRRFRFL
jgi:hypothetical protein